MSVCDYLAIYKEEGLSRLNAALVGLNQERLILVLRELEKLGFETMTFIDDDILVSRLCGVIICGP